MKNHTRIDTPLISVIALCYNHTQYCISALQSIYNQTYENLELILIDDSSSDNSVKLINDWIKTHPSLRIKFIAHKENKGICKSLNEAYSYTKGKYIAFLACDDLMMSEKLSKQIKYLKDTPSNIGLVYSDAIIIDENGNQLYDSWLSSRLVTKPYEGSVFKEVLKTKFLLLQSVLVKRTVFKNIGLFDESLTYEDYDVFLRISSKYSILYSNYISCKYRKIDKGTSKKAFSRHTESTIKILLKHREHKDLSIHKIIRFELNFLLLGALGADYQNTKKLMKKYPLENELYPFLKGLFNYQFIMKILHLPFKYRYKLYTLKKIINFFQNFSKSG